MYAYATVGSTNFAASSAFYDATFATLGLGRIHDYSDSGWIAYGNPAEKDNPNTQTLWLSQTPFNEQPATVGNGMMLSLLAKSRTQVDAFHAAALATGGSSEGAPGTREAYGPDFYVAYVRDPMGNKFSVIFRGPA
jgi:catechol 2,3-dioxygenase-like lactoylglutathione lyase family enzyme